jgi:antitoxin ParD1/3/4
MTLSYNAAMSARAAKPVTVTLGPLAPMARQRVGSGRYASLSEVVRAGLRALEREEQALDAVLKARVEAALADPAPSLPQDEVLAALREHHAKRSAA